MAHDVFISYSSHDKPTADAVCATLENHGLRCWIAPRDIVPGMDWSDAIIDAITECRVFVLILSGASNQSEQVKREVQNAVGEAKPIMPLRIEEVDLSKHMRYFIGTPHWLDALTPPMEIHLQRMAQTVRTLIESMSDKGIAPLPAPAQSLEDQYRPRDTTEAVQAEPAAPQPVDSPAAPVISEAAETRAAQILADFIGPLARVLAKRAARAAVSRDDFYARLADQIPTADEKARFFKRVNG
jgi:hypothetical protein